MGLIPISQVKVYAEQLGFSAAEISEIVLAAAADEIEYRLRELIQDSAKYMIHSKRNKLTVEDLNSALKDRNQALLYGYDPMEQLMFRNIPNTEIFYVPNEEVNLLDVLQEPLPKATLPPTLTCHALAIEGVQPAIPENPVIHGDKVDLGGKASTPVSRRELIEEAEVKPLVKHVLSKELLLYYDTLINDLTDSRPEASLAALKSLEGDAGLQQLLPYLLQFIAEGVPKNLSNPKNLLILMQSATALLKNPYLFIEPYLHQLMPPVLSCLLGKKFGQGGREHWTVREEAAGIVAIVCVTYGNAYSSLVPRVAKTLVKAWLDNDKPLSTHYGAISGIAAIGAPAIDALILPHLLPYLSALNMKMHWDSDEHVRVYEVLEKCGKLWISHFEGICETDANLTEKRNVIFEAFNKMNNDQND